jgi:hypothetical protein
MKENKYRRPALVVLPGHLYTAGGLLFLCGVLSVDVLPPFNYSFLTIRRYASIVNIEHT